jgi:hypothetical protein
MFSTSDRPEDGDGWRPGEEIRTQVSGLGKCVDAKDAFQYLLFNTRSTSALEGYAKGKRKNAKKN